MIHSEQFRIASLLVKLGNSVTYYRNYKMENIGLTSIQSDALIAILRNPGITATELKLELQLSQSTIAGIISRLEKKGIISKTVDIKDARKIILMPTQKGKDLEYQLRKIALDAQETLTKGMDANEENEFGRLLNIALTNMNFIRAYNQDI